MAATLTSFMKRSIFVILSRGTKTMSPGCNVKYFQVAGSPNALQIQHLDFRHIGIDLSETLLPVTTSRFPSFRLPA